MTFPRLGHLGRLGNQLWQIAGTVAYAQRLGTRMSLPKWEYAEWFSVPEGVFTDEAGIDAGTLAGHLGPAAPYLQDWELVESAKGTIRTWFRPSNLALQLILPSSQWIGTCAVHVRRTDYLLTDHYAVPDAWWYRRAMGAVRERAEAEGHPVSRFVFFSDDPAWCRSWFPEHECVTGDEQDGWDLLRDDDGHPLPRYGELTDFWSMAACRYHITANSSFSWWAAWISDDRSPVTPARWYGPAYPDLCEDRVIPPWWTRL